MMASITTTLAVSQSEPKTTGMGPISITPPACDFLSGVISLSYVPYSVAGGDTRKKREIKKRKMPVKIINIPRADRTPVPHITGNIKKRPKSASPLKVARRSAIIPPVINMREAILRPWTALMSC